MSSIQIARSTDAKKLVFAMANNPIKYSKQDGFTVEGPFTLEETVHQFVADHGSLQREVSLAEVTAIALAMLKKDAYHNE